MSTQRVDASKFIMELTATTPEKARLRIVLTDNTLIRRLAAERLLRLHGTRAVLHSGKNPVQEAVEALSTQDLFGAPAPVWIELPEKITSKQWNEFTTQLNHLSDPARQELYIFAPAATRHGAPDPKALPWKAEVLVIYEPARAEAINLLTTLIPRHGGILAQANKPELLAWAHHCFDHYSGDLEACDLHFEQMAKGGLAFEAAFIPKTGLDAFDVIEALSSGDTNLVHLRLGQLEQAGEEAGSVISALAYTGRQVLAFQAALAKTSQSRQAHDMAKTPYPSQARVERLAKLLPPEKWARFFLVAAELEKQTRTQRDAHSWLAVELTGLLS
ncbi:MAG: hypothetical protein FJY29_10875 [Betaproteobacteria bacterium]|nr:hypothetical protein [Betaproteobacteria bacterium]